MSVIANESGIATDDDQRSAHALEEEEDDERDEHERLDDLLLEAVVGRAHERRLIEDRP